MKSNKIFKLIIIKDQSNRHLSKATDPKPVSRISSQVAPSVVQNARAISKANINIANQHGKTKLSTLNQFPPNKNTNSVSIIPLNKMQNLKPVTSSDQTTKKFPSNLSPKNSPRSSPNLQRTASSKNTSSALNSVPTSRKPSMNVSNLISKEKLNYENSRNNNNEVVTRENFSTKLASLALNQHLNIGISNSNSILKRKLENSVDPLGITVPNQVQKTNSYKRIKPTMISSTVSPKWSQLSNTITIDDDDDDDESSKRKLNHPQKVNKSRSNSIASSGPSPSPSISSNATSPQSQSSPTTPSPSLKDSNRRASTPKTGNITESLTEKAKILGSSRLEDSRSENKTSEKTEENLRVSSDSPIPNGNMSGGEESFEKKQTNEIIPAFEKLIEACRKSEKSSDMEILIEKKLLKYYHSIHPDFITSKSFKKTVENITNEILETPSLVYIKLKTIIEELKSRKNSKVIVVSNDGQTSTGNDEVDEKVRRLNKGLRKLKHMISKMEEEEVDWDSEYSSYLKVEKFKKRACEIYEKICDLTGESKHAQRTVRKPIVFNHTSYPKINKAIETFVNKTKMFPDFHDILTILQHCNKTYNLNLTSEELKRIAQDAFVKVGKLLQNRRKTDLYETLSHYTEKIKDPALEDSDLNAKLTENKKHYGKINALIQKYAREQDTLQSEKLKAKEQTRKSENNVDSSEHEDNNEINKTQIDSSKDNNFGKQAAEVNDKIRNTPSCSYTTYSSKSQGIVENDKNIVHSKKGESNNEELLKNCVGNKECNDNKKCNSNIEEVKNNKTNIESNSISKINSAKTVVSKDNSSKTSNSCKVDPSSLKIVNVTSLSEKSKTNISLSKSSTSNSKSVMPSTSNLNNFSKNNISDKNKEIDEIILLDDDA
ncbi:death domain-associated protein 6 isoform X2 [Condylostylus longicornis]|uniref:death domain-associated protein 6 isoform X2 n=1 Tax=Condylostylus longicornis TaxID=2530218 RepID=UPI00244DAF36|nr:death domain-associated protein 6 isoform X2 [Condylostylus longicornis]